MPAAAGAALPIIDVSNLSSSDPAKRRAVGGEIREACLASGFLYCVGHGIPDGLREAVFAESRRLFEQPLAAKMAVDKSGSFCNRGYEVLGGQTLQAGAKPDLKEGYYIGLELPEDDPRVVSRRFNRGPNQWPVDLPAFKPVMNAWFAALLDLSERLMCGLALSLDLPEDHFAGFCRDPLAILRLLHYPPHPPQAGEDLLGAGAHTDFGGLTLLAQDDNGGLQVWDKDDERWIDAPPVPGAFVVNLGDMIARWTNDRYRSTLHRVINTSGRERYSVPFFYSGNPDFEVACIPTCLAAGEAPKYPPIRVEDHLMAMYRKTYAA
ncbi:oxidoreductase [Zhengella mangrovi]|uniref:2-oxoglutarate-dependent ethylene/succinate-forming enzyme n=1 Tax=Zhengella mangrovi TaxID=1982044 RepID=A0A2G1QIM2_9HYPH|nr:2-oxoglutarate and iron-dependent oxygenase domain-containing protein [Zhengella mangrovi]PHP65362.1 oxidoreductase [Zhengella mangrovi]